MKSTRNPTRNDSSCEAGTSSASVSWPRSPRLLGRRRLHRRRRDVRSADRRRPRGLREVGLDQRARDALRRRLRGWLRGELHRAEPRPRRLSARWRCLLRPRDLHDRSAAAARPWRRSAGVPVRQEPGRRERRHLRSQRSDQPAAQEQLRRAAALHRRRSQRQQDLDLSAARARAPGRLRERDRGDPAHRADLPRRDPGGLRRLQRGRHRRHLQLPPVRDRVRIGRPAAADPDQRRRSDPAPAVPLAARAGRAARRVGARGQHRRTARPARPRASTRSTGPWRSSIPGCAAR